MKTIELGVSVLGLLLFLGAGCGGDDSEPIILIDASFDAGDTGADTGTDATEEAAPGETVNGCGDAEFAANDHTGDVDPRLITFPNDANPSQYSPPCMLIKVGQTVAWQGAFSDHPLNAFGGDANNPITRTDSGVAQTFSFPNAGTFGFHCEVHPTIMFGAIRVVP
jgi:plastocyanin